MNANTEQCRGNSDRAKGGLGTHFTHQALERGALKVYAAARTPREWEISGVVPLTLDVNASDSIAAAAIAAPDVTLVINKPEP